MKDIKTKKPNRMKQEVDQLTPAAARLWCDVLRLDWMSFDKDRTYGVETWVQLLQIKANANDVFKKPLR
jgi:hypothetical protein